VTKATSGSFRIEDPFESCFDHHTPEAPAPSRSAAASEMSSRP